MMNKQIRNQLFKTLDKIYKSAVKLSKSFGLDTISLTILKGLIEAAKFTADDSNKELHEYIKHNNDLLDLLYKSCEDAVKKVKAEHLAPALLKIYINEIKSGINEGIK